MLDLIPPADQIRSPLDNTSFLCSQLAQIYSSFFIADEAKEQQGVINPFWNFSTQSVDKERVEKYKYAFIAKHLYSQLHIRLLIKMIFVSFPFMQVPVLFSFQDNPLQFFHWKSWKEISYSLRDFFFCMTFYINNKICKLFLAEILNFLVFFYIISKSYH